MSWTFITDKNSQIKCLEKEVWESEKMRFGKKMRFLMKPRRESASETITKTWQWKQEQFFHCNITFFKIGFCILSKTITKRLSFATGFLSFFFGRHYLFLQTDGLGCFIDIWRLESIDFHLEALWFSLIFN